MSGFQIALLYGGDFKKTVSSLWVNFSLEKDIESVVKVLKA